MLYYVFDLFAKSGLPGARLMHYTSFRVLVAIVIALLVSAWFGRLLDRHPKVGDVITFRNARFYVRKVRRAQVWEFNLKRHNDDD
jgi:hypothetical protein